jgi:hypothetical protein
MNSRERRLCLWSNATCAMPSCEALPSRRGPRAHHAQKDRVGTWDRAPGLTALRGSPPVRRRQQADIVVRVDLRGLVVTPPALEHPQRASVFAQFPAHCVSRVATDNVAPHRRYGARSPEVLFACRRRASLKLVWCTDYGFGATSPRTRDIRPCHFRI